MAVVYFRNRGIVSKNVSQKELGCFPISREENSSNQKLQSIFERGKQFESEAAKHFRERKTVRIRSCKAFSREENSSNQKLQSIFERGKQFESEAATHF